MCLIYDMEHKIFMLFEMPKAACDLERERYFPHRANYTHTKRQLRSNDSFDTKLSLFSQ